LNSTLWHKLKIPFAILLLSSMTLSSVFGIAQNESIRLNDISPLEIQQNDISKTTVLKSAIHETFVEKELVCENEQEDNKEKSFTETCFFIHVPQFFSVSLSQIGNTENFSNTLSFNILYCVFRL